MKRSGFGTFILDGKYVFWPNFVVFGRVVHFLSAFEVTKWRHGTNDEWNRIYLWCFTIEVSFILWEHVLQILEGGGSYWPPPERNRGKRHPEPNRVKYYHSWDVVVITIILSRMFVILCIMSLIMLLNKRFAISCHDSNRKNLKMLG